MIAAMPQHMLKGQTLDVVSEGINFSSTRVESNNGQKEKEGFLSGVAVNGWSNTGPIL